MHLFAVYEGTDVAGPLDHFFNGTAFLGERTGRASLNALSAIGATTGFAPLLVQVAHNSGMDAPRCDLPDVGSFQVGAYTDASCTQDAAVMVEHKARMGEVDSELGVVVGEADGADSHRG